MIRHIDLFPSPLGLCEGNWPSSPETGAPVLTSSPFTNLTIQQVVDFFWKVKAWQFDMNFTMEFVWDIADSSDCDYTGSQVTTTITSDFSATMTDGFSSPSELVCSPKTGWSDPASGMIWDLRDLPINFPDGISQPTILLNKVDGAYTDCGIEFLLNTIYNNFTGRSSVEVSLEAFEDVEYRITIIPNGAFFDTPPPSGIETPCNITIDGEVYSTTLNVSGYLLGPYDNVPDQPADPCAFGPLLASTSIVSVNSCSLTASEFHTY